MTHVALECFVKDWTYLNYYKNRQFVMILSCQDMVRLLHGDHSYYLLTK